MYRSREDSDITVKDRIRDEISSQIEEFLKRGGQIDILHPRSERVRLVAGATWQDRLDNPAVNPKTFPRKQFRAALGAAKELKHIGHTKFICT